jgi:hypothetical protein
MGNLALLLMRGLLARRGEDVNRLERFQEKLQTFPVRKRVKPKPAVQPQIVRDRRWRKAR